jgi:hypothetical protein
MNPAPSLAEVLEPISSTGGHSMRREKQQMLPIGRKRIRLIAL